MSQDSDGIAEAMRGGAQLGVTLAAQAVETTVRVRERARLAAAADATRVAEDAQRRLAAERAVALVGVADRRDLGEQVAASVSAYDSRIRREHLQERLNQTVGPEGSAARVVADAAQARPAVAVATLPPPTPGAPGAASRRPGADRTRTTPER